jgi:DNA-directed RNA polymerase subunit RPC12/RpoP
MFMNLSCPTCGHSCRVPERMLGQHWKCPACSTLFQCGSVSPRSLVTRPVTAAGPAPVQETPTARTVQVQPDQCIHYRCPRCTRPLESPSHMAGQKLNCPDCGQRLQVPQSSLTPSPADPQRIHIAEERVKDGPAVPVFPARQLPHVSTQEEPILTVLPVAPSAPATPARREYCLECGADVTQRSRIQTCPDCGSLFCSARCFRDHHYHAHSPRSR